jgi:hypothetical protein
MAVERKSQPAAASARADSNNATKKTLGFINLNLPTAKGNPIRVDAVRLIEGNKTHEQVAAYLGCTRPGDEKMSADELVAEKARRLSEFTTKLEFSFNPTRTDEESMLDLV